MNNTLESKQQEALDVIKSSKKVLLHCHPHPDPDCVGSALAMYTVLKNLDKDVELISGDSLPSTKLKRLPNFEVIVSKNFTEVELSDFDLFIILDSSSTGQITRLTEVIFPENLKTIVIDHHITNEGFGDVNIIDTKASSTSEVLFNLFRAWEVEINADTALCLFTGIFSDTGGFKYTNTSVETLSTISQLAAINPNYHSIIFDIENHSSPQSIKMKGLAFSSVETYFDGHIAISSVNFDTMKVNGITKEFMTSGLVASDLRSVVGWDLDISMVEAEPDVVTISIRTRDESKYDVSLLAKAVGQNGGGHKAAAGTTVFGSINNAKEEILRKLPELYSIK